MRVSKKVKTGMIVCISGNWIVPASKKNKRRRLLGVWQGEQNIITPNMTTVMTPEGAVVSGIAFVKIKKSHT